MPRTSFHEGWSYRKPIGPFAAVQGGPGVALTPVTLPHDALRDVERTPDAPSGPASAYWPSAAFTYVKRFDVPAEWGGKCVSLFFEGVMRHALVYVNDAFAASRADGYSGFAVPLDGLLRYGEANEVRVEVRVHSDSRWYSGAGIHRPVTLIVTDPVHIATDGVVVTTPDVDDDLAIVEVATRVVNETRATRSVRVRQIIRDAEGTERDADDVPATVRPGETIVVRQRLLLRDPRRWACDDPYLHTVTTTLTDGDTVDERETGFGVRTLRLDPVRGLRINDEVVKLRGACIHHDNGALGAVAIGRAEERRVELLKAAGFNAIRTAHNPASRALLDACDRHGVLVMNETWDMWHQTKTDFDHALDFEQWWERDVDAMVASSINHPSVIFYSIGNEIPEAGTPHGASMARRIADRLRALDPTRYVTNGINVMLAVMDWIAEQAASGAGGGLNELMGDMVGGQNALAVTDLASDRIEEACAVLDAAGFNYADGRYELDLARHPHRVIVGSETFPTRIATLWALVERHPHVLGDFTWTGFDYLGEAGVGQHTYAEDPDAVPGFVREFPALTAFCADLDLTGYRMPQSHYREIVFGLASGPFVAVQRPEHHDHTRIAVTPWEWTDCLSSWTWPGFEGRPVTVEVYADADEVELLLDGRPVGRATVGETLPFVAVVETTWAPGELVAVAYRDGSEAGRSSLRSASGVAALRVEADRAEIRAAEDDLAFLTIELVDAAGILNAASDRPVRVTVGGAGVLAGLGSGNPRTAERFDASERTTFDGRALAIVRPTSPGEITVTVSAEGVPDVVVTLRAR